VVLRSVIVPGFGGTKVVDVVVVGGKVVVVVVVVGGKVEPEGSVESTEGTVTGGAKVDGGTVVAELKQSVPGRYKRMPKRRLGTGVTKTLLGRPTRAASMVAFHIRAGKVPPWTRGTPTATNSGMLFIGKYKSG
jgi:hypothetical protein